MLCIKNGTVHDGVHREGFQADILVEDGKIKAIGENLEIPGDAEVVDADGPAGIPPASWRPTGISVWTATESAMKEWTITR